MLPLSDGVPARKFPVVTVALIAANFAVWIFYELPHLGVAVHHASFYACAVNGSCHGPEPWAISWITAMFLHGSWHRVEGVRNSVCTIVADVTPATDDPRMLVRKMPIIVAVPACAGVTALIAVPPCYAPQAVLKERFAFGYAARRMLR